MFRMYAKYIGGLALAGLIPVTHAFSPEGPTTGVAWQTTANGYQQGGDVVSPRPLPESFRWSSPIVCYRIDRSVTDYWGPRAVTELRKAAAIMNDLPSASGMVVTNFTMDAKRVNYSAQGMRLLDIKTVALWSILETVGVGDSIRWTWAIRDHTDVNNAFVSANVIHRNYDPITLQPSSYVNGTLYTYFIFHTFTPHFTDAIEVKRYPLQRANAPIATEETIAGIGEFANRLTRDDAGALKYLYTGTRERKETLTPDVTIGGPGSSSYFESFSNGGTNFFVFLDPWTGLVSTNTVVATGWRGGVEKLQFVEYNDSLGTNMFNYIDTVYTDQRIKFVQNLTRRVGQATPDIQFQVGDIGLTGGDLPLIIARTATARFTDYSAINSAAYTEGPGIIRGPIQITFNSLLPSLVNNSSTRYLNEDQSFTVENWGSFDGSTNVPVIYYGNGIDTPIY